MAACRPELEAKKHSLDGHAYAFCNAIYGYLCINLTVKDFPHEAQFSQLWLCKRNPFMWKNPWASLPAQQEQRSRGLWTVSVFHSIIFSLTSESTAARDRMAAVM